ncbi:MAG: hypothetical protein EZS28_046601, partial [Streblomastix strix]
LNRGAAAISLLKLTDRILEVAEDLNLQIHAFHILGKENTIPVSLSRLATTGDYSLKEENLHEVHLTLTISPSIDMFPNRRNRKFRRFVSLSQDKWAVAQDCLSILWQLEVLYLLPSILLMQKTPNKLTEEKEQALTILLYQISQPLRPVLMKMASRLIILGDSVDVLVPGDKIKKQKKHLPPGRMMAVLLDATEEKNYSDGFLVKEVLPALPFRTSQTVGMRLGEDIVKDQGT